jgi:hypothetical protein
MQGENGELRPVEFSRDDDVRSGLARDRRRFLINLGAESARQPPLTVVRGRQQRLVGK